VLGCWAALPSPQPTISHRCECFATLDMNSAKQWVPAEGIASSASGLLAMTSRERAFSSFQGDGRRPNAMRMQAAAREHGAVDDPGAALVRGPRVRD
jgi:hypothetical protein